MHGDSNSLLVVIRLGLGGESVDINVAPHEQVSQLKEELEQVVQTPREYQRLLHEDRELDDSDLLSSLNLSPGAALQFLRKEVEDMDFVNYCQEGCDMSTLLCTYLSENGADLNATMSWQNAPDPQLHERPEIAYANEVLRTMMGDATSLHFCALHGRENVCRFLIRSPLFTQINAKTSYQDNDNDWGYAACGGHGLTALHVGVLRRTSNVCCLILSSDRFTDVNACHNHQGMYRSTSTMADAVSVGLPDVCSLLMNHPSFAGLDEIVDCYDTTLLMLAVCGNTPEHTSICKMILQNETFSRLSEFCCRGNGFSGSAFELASRSGALEACQLLLEHKFFSYDDINIAKGGCSALHLAAANGHVEICNLLLREKRFTAINAVCPRALFGDSKHHSTTLVSAYECAEQSDLPQVCSLIKQHPLYLEPGRNGQPDRDATELEARADPKDCELHAKWQLQIRYGAEWSAAQIDTYWNEQCIPQNDWILAERRVDPLMGELYNHWELLCQYEDVWDRAYIDTYWEDKCVPLWRWGLGEESLEATPLFMDDPELPNGAAYLCVESSTTIYSAGRYASVTCLDICVTEEPSLKCMVCGHEDGTIHMWEQESNAVLGATWHEKVAFVDCHQGPVSAVRLLNGGDFVLSGGADGHILLWSLNDLNEPVMSFGNCEDDVEAVPAHSTKVDCLIVRSDQRAIFSAGSDGVFCWDFLGKKRYELDPDTSTDKRCSAYGSWPTKTNDACTNAKYKVEGWLAISAANEERKYQIKSPQPDLRGEAGARVLTNSLCDNEQTAFLRCGRSGIVSIFGDGLSDGQPIFSRVRALAGHDSEVQAAAACYVDERLVASGGRDGSCIVQLGTGEDQACLFNVGALIQAIVFCDFALVVLTSEDIQVWLGRRLLSKTRVCEIGSTSITHMMALMSPSGSSLAELYLAGEDGIVRVPLRLPTIDTEWGGWFTCKRKRR